MSKELKITKNEDRKWRPRVEMKYVGECDADKLSKILKKHDLLWCHDYLLTGYYFYLPSKVKELKGIPEGQTYYVNTRISEAYNKKKGRYFGIAEIHSIQITKRLREGKTF